MAENEQVIRYTPENWHAEANQHDEIAATVWTAKLAGADIGASAHSLGPIMHELKAAVAELLPVRDARLQKHYEARSELAATMRTTVNTAVATNEDAAANIASVVPGNIRL